MAEDQGTQLGDFIKGRMLFIEDYCLNHGLNFKDTVYTIEEEMMKKADSQEKKEFLKNRVFHGVILSTSILPNWVDKAFLEAMVAVLKGPGAPLYTTTSRISCISFEAGRFNAKRQADTIFKILFQNKKPADWLRTSFPGLYRKCYGEQAGNNLKMTERNPGNWEIVTDNTHLEKASRIDCSTVIGYLFGSLERLGAKNIIINHNSCKAEAPAGQKLCVFDITFDN